MSGSNADRGHVRRLALVVPLIAFFSVLAPALPANAAETYHAALLRYTNIERTKRHLPPLRLSSCLQNRYGIPWAKQLAKRRTLAHQRLGPIMTNCHGNRVGENVATGNVTAARMVQMWMASSGHRANILNPAFTHLGVGAIRGTDRRVYGVQDFLRAS
jgi:uncharacterized protein YkwD